MTFFVRMFFVALVVLGSWFSLMSSVSAGTCSVRCQGSATAQSFEIGRRSECLGLCPAICQYPPDSWVGVVRGGGGTCAGPATFTGSEAPPPPPVVDGTCEAVCGDGYLRDTLYFNEPDRIRNPQECATRCQEACDAHTSSLGFPFTCFESSYHAPRASESSPETNALDCPWYEQDGPEDGSGPVTCQPNSGRNSNTQGTAARRTPPRVSAPSGNCEYNGVHDPFCGKSIAEIIGTMVRFLLGAAGALFLAMFVYGGAVWLTAAASDRHEEARKTLLNATAGILIVIASYTIVSLLVRFVGGLGVTQSNEAAQFEEETTQDAGVSTPSASIPTSETVPASETVPPPTASCNETRFTEACVASCRPTGAADACEINVCSTAYTWICGSVFTRPATNLTMCTSYCSSACEAISRGVDSRLSWIGMTRPQFTAFGCESACPGWCRAMFSESPPSP